MSDRALELTRVANLDAARDDWIRLADAAGNPFTTWEWASGWWRHFGGDRELLVSIARRPDRTAAAILPLYVSATSPARTVRFVGQGPADQLAPVCAPEDLKPATLALRDALESDMGGWQVAIADRLPGEAGIAGLLGGRVVRSESSPVLHHDGDFDSFLASRSRNFREQVRRRERRLERDHRIAFRLTDDPERLESDFETLVRLHRARWGESSSAFQPPLDRFHHEFAGAALERGWLRLWTLEVDGRPAACWLGYRMGGAEWYYQAGRDPALEREAVGFVLMAHTVRETLDDGIGEYRLLLGGEGYKDRFANADHGLETVALGRGVRGRLALAAARAASAAPPVLRRQLRRLAG
ncbi:MAG: GNAT family N-acetyltransferase [Actinobacteria bacterium]|nr:MAG: GNAT family N-acetyltransferase [Actinomycetota bacterium]